MEALDVFIVIGTDPDSDGNEPTKVLEVYLEQKMADGMLANGLLQSYMKHLEHLEPGGQLSLIINRKGDDPASPQTTGSFVINNIQREGKPLGDRHVWDFRVEKRTTFSGS